MAHLRNFSHENHSLYIHDRSIQYSANGVSEPLQFNDNGTIRSYDLYRDFDNTSINFDGSAFRNARFPPLRYNDNLNIVNNILNEFDFTGVSIRDYSTQKYTTVNDTFPNLYGNSGKLNPDSWNCHTYPIILITPRHAVIAAHPVDYCNTGAQDIDSENFYSCCCESCNPCQEGSYPAFYQWIYINSKWMGKNNQIINAFQNYTIEEVIAAFRAKNFAIAPRIKSLRPEGVDAFIIEYPFDIATPENQITYYSNFTETNLVNLDETVYTVTGSLAGIKTKFSFSGLREFDDNYYKLNSFAIPGTLSTWVGDSGSPRFVKRNNQIIFIGMISGLINSPTAYSLIADFIQKGPTNYVNLLRFGISPGSEVTLDYSKYFGTSQFYSPLGGTTYGSRFTDNERNVRNYSEIAYAPGNALQASELNEMQEVFQRDITLRNKFLSHLAIENYNGRSSIFKQSIPNELQSFKLGQSSRGTWSEGPYSPEMNNGEYALYSYDDQGSLIVLPNIQKPLSWLKNGGQGIRGGISPRVDITKNDYMVDWSGRIEQYDQYTSVVVGFFLTHSAETEGHDFITNSGGSFEKLVGFYNNRTTNKWVAAIYRRATSNSALYIPYFEFTTTALSTQTNNLKVIITDAGTTARFYVNDVKVTETSGNLPQPNDVIGTIPPNVGVPLGSNVLMGLHMRRLSEFGLYTVSGTLRTNKLEGKIYSLDTLPDAPVKQYAIPEREIENTLVFDETFGYYNYLKVTGWSLFNHRCGLQYFNYTPNLESSLLDQENSSLETQVELINYQTDSNLNDPISNFYGASRLKFTYEPDGVNTYYVQNLNNVMYTVDGRRFTNTVG